MTHNNSTKLDMRVPGNPYVVEARPILVLEFRRRELRLSLQSLSDLSQLKIWYLSLLESGRLQPTDSQREKLSTVLGVQPQDLMKPITLDISVTAVGRIEQPA